MRQQLLDIFIHNSKPPTYLEVPVNPELKPFLVTSSRSFVWTERIQNDKVWTVPRELGDNIQAEIVAEVVTKSHAEQWGNLFPMTTDGFNGAVDRLRKSGFVEIDVLINANSNVESYDEENVTLVRTGWVPLGCAVFVPEQREYVGNLIFFEGGKGSICVHNSRYGMAVAVQTE